MTLPRRILDHLAQIDQDRAVAIVKATEAVMGSVPGRFKPVELVEMAPGKSLIVVGPCKALKRIPWLGLIEIARARYLLSIPSGTPIEALEVAVRDLVHQAEPRIDDREIAVLEDLLDLIGRQRRTSRLSKAELLIIDSE